jgi:hypothetical protein
MVPMGLKETKEVNFMEPFSDFILEHYSEDSIVYEDSIADITDTRQVIESLFTSCKTSLSGVSQKRCVLRGV